MSKPERNQCDGCARGLAIDHQGFHTVPGNPFDSQLCTGERYVPPAPLPLLYSRRSDGGVQTWRIELLGSRYRTHSGVVGGVETASDWTDAKHSGANSAIIMAAKQVKARHLKKEKEGYYTDVADIDKERFYQVMLAEPMKDFPELVARAIADGRPLYVQPKFDGMRCLARQSGLWTRNGKPILSTPHVYKAYESVRDGFDFSTGTGGPASSDELMLDGELYSHDFKANFNKIISLAKKLKPTDADLAESAEKLFYYVYDLPSHSGPFKERYDSLRYLIGDSQDGVIRISETHLVTSMDEINEWFFKWRSQGYEGLMLRFGNSYYEKKRSRGLLKHKQKDDAEFEVLDVIARDNDSGQAGAFAFQTAAGQPFTAGLMGDAALFTTYLRHKERYIGKTATVEYQGLTPDGVPRFPHMKAIREDY